MKKVLSQEKTYNTYPSIALVASGGGMRAAVCCAGVMQALEEAELVDAIRHVACLSGSSWFFGPWITSGLSVKDFITQFKKRIERPFVDDIKPESIKDALLRNMVYGKPLSIVDTYGTILDSRFAVNKDSLATVSLVDQAKHIAQAQYPLPLYTALVTNVNPHYWMEFTPYWVCVPHLQSWVRPEFYGRVFVNGTSRDDAPPYSLGHMLAVSGSAVNISIREITAILGKGVFTQPLYDFFIHNLREIDSGGLRVFPEFTPNYTYGMQHMPFANQRFLVTVDAGIEIGIPLAPLLRPERWPDLLIIIDADDPIKGSPDLKKAIAYAKECGYALPPCNFEELDKKSYTFISSRAPGVPSVLYIPYVYNEKYSKTYKPEEEVALGRVGNTFNFVYTSQQFDEMAGLTKYAMQEAVSVFKRELQDLLAHKAVK